MTIAELREVFARQQAETEELRAMARPPVRRNRLCRIHHSIRLRRSVVMFALAGVAIGGTGILAYAADISLPATRMDFTAGNPIVAADVNSNFTALYGNDVEINNQLFWGAVTGGIGYSSGNVGIGTAAPGSKLEVSTSAQFPLRLVGSDSWQTALALQNTTSADAIWSFCVGGSGNNSGGAGVGGFGIMGGAAPQQFRLSLSPSGNVGIGLTNPQHKLDIMGSQAVHAENDGWSADLRLFDFAGYKRGAISLGDSASGAPGLTFLTSPASTNISYPTHARMTITPDGRIGIGTMAPGDRLHVSGNIRLEGTSPYITFSDSDNSTWNSISLDSQFLYIAGGTAASTIIFRNKPTYGETMRIDSSGNLGIGRAPSTYRLEVEGDASKTTAGGFLANSDLSIKREIEEIPDAVTTLMRLRPVKFRYSPGYMSQHPSVKDAYYYNYIAQEYREVFPDSVTMTPEGILSMDSHNANVIAVRAIQEQQVEIAALRAEAERLQSIIAALGARLDALEAETGAR